MHFAGMARSYYTTGQRRVKGGSGPCRDKRGNDPNDQKESARGSTGGGKELIRILVTLERQDGVPTLERGNDQGCAVERCFGPAGEACRLSDAFRGHGPLLPRNPAFSGRAMPAIDIGP